MSAKTMNTVLAVLLALVLTFNAIAPLVATTTQASSPTATLAMEVGTTKS